ncbi:MAG: carboxypeptidase regulatory-like domain-containing protein [Pedobacter sp.]|nr:MAG: carboxypeptidase regulatory-like domain-containing protein [Pedobacter sp.]
MPQSNAEMQEPESAVINHGSISGKIIPTPVSEISLIISNASNGKKVIVDGYVNINGEFYFPGLPSGSYTLDLSANSRYMPLDFKAIQVTSGKQTDVGTIVLKPNPDNGNIIGIISPVQASSAFIVQCVEPFSSNSYSGVVDPATGHFEITNLPAGKWSIYFQPNNGFKPQNSLITINNKQTANIGTITFESAPFVSSISMIANGKTLRMTGSAIYDGTKLNISGRYSRGVNNSIGDGIFNLTISLDQVTVPGTYVCNSTTTSKITYTQNLYGLGAPNGTWASTKEGSDATIIVTNVDLANKTIKGTFTANLGTTTSSKIAIQQITSGSFTAIYN